MTAVLAGLAEVVDDAGVVVVVGAGGVGKTSTSAAVAHAAASGGRRVCLVTVDPARRLADALGGVSLGPEPVRLDLDTSVPGELWALMLDPKFVFDRLVESHAESVEQAEHIVANAFYQRLSTSLAGVHEYMAIEQLHLLSVDERFDLVVVDTPPSDHVLDLVDAPDRLARFLDNRMYRTLIRPASGVARLATGPARAFTKRVAAVVGGQILDDAIGFFEAFNGMEAGFVERATLVRAALGDGRTSFVAVATPAEAAIDAAVRMRDDLAERGIAIRATIANMTTADPWADVEPHVRNAPSSPELVLRLEALRDRHDRAEAEAVQLEALRALGSAHGSIFRRAGEVARLAELAAMGAELTSTAP